MNEYYFFNKIVKEKALNAEENEPITIFGLANICLEAERQYMEYVKLGQTLYHSVDAFKNDD